MITRIWHGRTRSEHADEYLEFLSSAGTKEYGQTEGNVSAKIWRKRTEDNCDFWTVTEWTDMDAVRRFAGDNPRKAKYYPQDNGMLLEFENTVEHYECFDVSRTMASDYVRQLEQLYSGGSWQGESFLEKLRDVDEKMAFAAPVPGVHSIGEIVWHCVYWRTVMIKRIEGRRNYREETIEKFNFLPLADLKTKGWQWLKDELAGTQSYLVDFLRKANDTVLRSAFQPGCTFGFLIEGVVQHDVYHLGQIGLVKRMIGP